MAIFTLYFTICLLALLIRGYYRVPMSCIRNELLDKDEKTMKSIIEDRMECKCHYTNFLWSRVMISNTGNRTITNSSDEQQTPQEFQTWGLVRIHRNFQFNCDIHLTFRFSIYSIV